MIINTVNIQNGPVASSKATGNSSESVIPTPVNIFYNPTNLINYKDKYLFAATTSNATFVRFNDLNNLTNYTLFTTTGTGIGYSVTDLGVPGKLYAAIGPGNGNTTSKALIFKEIDVESLAVTDVINTTTSQANYCQFFDATTDGTYVYISDSGPFSRIYKYDMATWTLQGTYIATTNGRLGSVTHYNGYLYATTIQPTASNTGVTGTAYHYIAKINASTMASVQEVSFGAAISTVNYPFACYPWQKIESISNSRYKKNYIIIGNYLYINFGRNPTTQYSFWKFDLNDISVYTGVSIPGFTGDITTHLFAQGDQFFIYNSSSGFKMCKYDTSTSTVDFIRNTPYSPLATTSTTIGTAMSSDCRVLYTAAFGNSTVGTKCTRQRF